MRCLFLLLLTFVAVTTGFDGFWHVINPEQPYPSSQDCQKFDNNMNEFGNMFTSYNMWTSVASGDYNRNSTVYGSQYAIHQIWKHQHPSSCQGKRFAIAATFPSGFGSELHVLGQQLLAALHLDVILLLYPFASSMWEVENPFCQSRNSTNFECYFESISSCTIFDALGENAVEMIRKLNTHSHSYKSTNPIPNLYDDVLSYSLTNFNATAALIAVEGYRVIHFTGVPHHVSLCLPEAFVQLLKCSTIRPGFYVYWWRTISLVYLLRPNRHTTRWIKDHAIPQLEDKEPFMGVYVRRGDKYVEMKLVETETYLDAVKKIFSLPQYSTRFQTRRIFLGSEDARVVREWEDWCKKENCQLFFTNIFDRAKLRAGLNREERESWNSSIKVENHHPEEYLSMILNIYYLVRGNGYVCTLMSNFCRVIDELRAFYGRAQRPYADLSSGSCKNAPCIYYNLTYFYN